MEIFSDEESTWTEWSENRIPSFTFRNRRLESADNISDESRDKDLARNVTDMNAGQKVTHSTCPQLLRADGNGPLIHKNNNVTAGVGCAENTKSSICVMDNASNLHSHVFDDLDSLPQTGAGNNHPGQTGSCLSPGSKTSDASDDLTSEIQSQLGALSVSPEVVGEVTLPASCRKQRAKKKPKRKVETVYKEDEEAEIQVALPLLAAHTWIVFLRLAGIPERFLKKDALVEIISDISGFKLDGSVIDVRLMDRNSRLALVSVKCPMQTLHDDFLEVVSEAGVQACSKCSGTDQKDVKTTTTTSNSSGAALPKFKVNITFSGLSKEHMATIDRKTVVDYFGNLTDMYLKEERLEADRMNGATGNSLTFRAGFVDKDSADKFFKEIHKISTDAGFTASLMTTEDIAIQDIWEEIFDKAQVLADEQRKKLEEVSDELEQIQNTDKKKWRNLDEFERKQAKVKPLNIKYRELQEQNEEFTQYVNDIQEKVSQLKNAKEFKSEADRLRTEFELETIRFSSALPMYAKRRKIVETVRSNRVSIVLGDTGSGKSTQILQYLHYAGISDRGLIVCTQPRKVAAVSLATRVAEEMGTRVGQLVGYQVGMQTKRSPCTKILYVTDHVLLNGCLKDNLFSEYACVVIDEAHERSIYTDLLLGFVKRALTKRDDLRVLITSATINPQVFTRYFASVAPPPVLDVPGRVFPVDVSYEKRVEEDYVVAAVNKAAWIIQETEDPGDVLVFLTNPLETEKACKMLRARYSDQHVLALECHGRLQLEEQQRVFVPTPPGKRKVVFATNSAETSVTIPGIKYVIDTGRVREMTYDPKKKMNVLSLGWTTQSSANQRKGRAGRTDCGHCYRLYGEDQYNKMGRDSVPEILRINLAQGLLKLLLLGISDPGSFDFVESPVQDSIAESLALLEELGAYSAGMGVTETGKRLAQISTEPRLGTVVLRGIDANVGYEAMILAAVCSAGGSVFYRGGSQEDKLRSDRTKTRFCDELGDAVTGAMIYKEWDTIPMHGRGSWCKTNNINGKTMKCAQDILKDILHTFQQDLKMTVSREFSKDPKLNEKLARILLGCYHSNLARYLGHERLGYCLVRDPKEALVLHPSSSLLYMGELPKWVVYEQSLTTSEAYMTNVTYVDESWIGDILSTEKFDEIAVKLETEMPVSRRISGLGRQCIAKLTEQRAQGLQELEKKLKQLSPDTGGSRICVHLDSNKRCMMVFADRDLEPVVVSEVYSSLNEIRMTMREEMMEERIRPGSDVRFVLGSGLAVKSVLMPGERRQLAVLSTGHDTCHMRYVRDKLQQHFGEIESYTITPSFGPRMTSGATTMTSFSNNVIGYVTFKSADDAASAISFGQISSDFRLEFSTKGSPDPKSKSRSANFSVKVEVSRRPLTGIGHVQFRTMYARDEVLSFVDMFYVSKRLTQDNELDAEVSMKQHRRNPDEAILERVPQWATPAIVREALVDAIGNPGLSKDITNVVLPRAQPPSESEDRIQVSRFRDLIRRQLVGSRATIAATDYQVEMNEPKPKDFTMFAHLKFDDQDKADLAVDVLDGAAFGDQKVEARLDLKTTFIVSAKTHGLCIGDVRAEVDQMKRTSAGRITVQDWRRDNGSYMIQVEAQVAGDLRQVRPRLESVIHGQRMDLTSGKYLQMKSDDALRKNDIQRTAGVRIRLDDRQQSVFVYGKMESVDRAKRLIEDYLNRTKSNVQKELDLRDACYPRGIMKSLVLECGLNLERLKGQCGAFSLDLNLKRHSIKFNGSKESYDRLKALVGQTAERLQGQGLGLRLPDPDPAPDCAVCLTGVDYDDCYVTESCGHFYCTDCCTNLIRSGLASNDLPIRCAVEDCPETLSLRDVQSLVRNIEEVFEPAVRSFIAKSDKEFAYCSTPDCPSFYRRTKRADEFVCSICHASLCTVCDAAFHPGTTCEQRSAYEKANADIKDWLRCDPEKRILCPKCGVGIEKDGGCNHMECTSCKAHICWKCKKFFKTGDSCMQHLSIKHGGIYDDEMLNRQLRFFRL